MSSSIKSNDLSKLLKSILLQHANWLVNTLLNDPQLLIKIASDNITTIDSFLVEQYGKVSSQLSQEERQRVENEYKELLQWLRNQNLVIRPNGGGRKKKEEQERNPISPMYESSTKINGNGSQLGQQSSGSGSSLGISPLFGSSTSTSSSGQSPLVGSQLLGSTSSSGQSPTITPLYGSQSSSPLPSQQLSLQPISSQLERPQLSLSQQQSRFSTPMPPQQSRFSTPGSVIPPVGSGLPSSIAFKQVDESNMNERLRQSLGQPSSLPF